MRYRVTFRKRFNQVGVGSDAPPTYLDLTDGVVQKSALVERIEPENLHGEERMEEDDDFLSMGSEVWDYDVTPGREDEFKFAPKNSKVVMEYDEIDPGSTT